LTSVFVPASRTDRPDSTAGPDVRLFSVADYAAVHEYFDARPDLMPTPLRPLPSLARSLGIGTLLAKDETARFDLNAFKLLGARFAVDRLIATGAIGPGDTLVCASEGNHGRAVARAARTVGCQARVYLANSVAPARAAAIEGEGAAVVRVPGSYDDAVRRAAVDAERHGWTVVSDTSWQGYEAIPRLIMLGYTRLAEEMAAAMGPGWHPDVVFVPGGVGGLLAGTASWCACRWPGRPPHVAAVEPASAACLQASARAGRPTAVPGPFATMMGGLRCGEVSPLAFAAALPLVSAYIAIDDEWAARAMRRLARPKGGDPAIEAGPSGAAALGGLLAALEDPDAAPARDALGLGPTSTIVVIVSEGVTDPEIWRRVVLES
jgi:diaminopropionate ammonia-lyase